MSLHYRLMRADDIDPCCAFFASLPIQRERYGDQLLQLPSAWRQLLDRQAKSALIFEEQVGSATQLAGLGISVFVQDDFIQQLKSCPFWIGPELVRRILSGPSPVLSDRELARRNGADGLNAVVWAASVAPNYEGRSDVQRLFLNAFIAEHRGYRWKEIVPYQMENGAMLQWALHAGAHWWDCAAGAYTDRLDPSQCLDALARRPFFLGMTPQLDRRHPGSWAGVLFEFSPPRFGLPPSAQRLLLAAMSGGTDQELSQRLGISLSAVKKLWLSTYERVTRWEPVLIPPTAPGGASPEHATDRGKEKKRHLLAYLQEHPEELRPYAAPVKAIGKAAGAATSPR